mmetsp:Transcript_15489/g.22443  ORF Transcript_15489/g.22443 Transcript_15489/m.22443 type:complete len:537 (-) Transcript_15489:350-1960(-)|eukprot:CAMPEP_0202450810 /NCGR_PEP_ID=MMETSP1360-20130828/9363_1 /ASSEMBLY_ACC=CAM_ASM_000848 /TAXON_ID=515479 /ORGANISM="Licmophora paradoxa, Strain CCMP2313" /LENGTH=536 /DNA_ID=CAMNT_0049069213 /DNA_START=39 /DNA_END=1649 /DNA_ORIENTATION=+
MSTPKRRRVKVEKVDRTVYDLLKEGIPELSRENTKMQSTAHVTDTGHDDAAVFESRTELPDEIPFTVDGTEKSTSHLLLLLGLKDGFTYQNETKVQNLVSACLNDALQLLDLSEDFLVESEFSVFSYRPDIVVVSHSLFGIILVIEVKKPAVDVFTSHEPAGQVYDHLLGNLLSGVSCPFAVLTTYDEMVIAHLDNHDSKSILKSNALDLHADLPQVVLDALELGESKEGKKKQDQQDSPKSKLNRVFDHQINADILGDDIEIEEENSDDDDDDDDDEYNRAVIYSQPFRGKEIMKALLLAIRCGLESVARSQPRTVPLEGGSARGSCVLVNDEGLVWTTMPETIHFTYQQFPGKSTQKLYLWRDLGRGSKGRVFLACNTQGKACAVKFFIIDDNLYHRQESSKEAREAWRQAQMKQKFEEADLERRYWITVYGDKFENQVRVEKWNKLWCLMMPYFDQLPNERREENLPAVEVFLETCKDKGLRYKDEDLRWRHVGARGSDVFVFDLGSLEKCDNEGDFDIESQIDKLKQKIVHE